VVDPSGEHEIGHVISDDIIDNEAMILGGKALWVDEGYKTMVLKKVPFAEKEESVERLRAGWCVLTPRASARPLEVPLRGFEGAPGLDLPKWVTKRACRVSQILKEQRKAGEERTLAKKGAE
jgi:hypothetical protein